MTIMDRELLFWILSTAPQVLAALVGLSFAAMTFKVGSIDAIIEKDDTQLEIQNEVKKLLYKSFKRIIIPSIVVITCDLLLIIITDWLLECEFRRWGTIVSFVVLNTYCLARLCLFPLTISHPEYVKKAAKFFNNSSSSSMTVDAATFILHFRDFERELRRLFPSTSEQSVMPVRQMIRLLKTDNILSVHDIDRMLQINQMRNVVVHESEIQTVDKSLDDDLQMYINIIRGIVKDK